MLEKIIIHTSYEEYPIFIGKLQKIIYPNKVLIISNTKVAGLYLDKVLQNIQAQEVYTYLVPDGEDYKNFDTIEKILESAFDFLLDRKSLMIALGGGVVSDMVGFSSGIYQRGIDFIAIPTTLLAQIDASIGGKTGINNRFGKNLIGIFHQPKAVYIDPSFLSSLPQREFKAGVAEMIKMAVCFDGDFFAWLEKNDLNSTKNLQKAIIKSVNIKAKVVELDEKESGIRAGLNYGHTFGHVIENQTNYKQFLHGEAVAIGMRMANDLALEYGYLSVKDYKRIELLLEKYGLNLDYKIIDIKIFYEKFLLDKKTFNQKIKFILPKNIGDLIIVDNISKENILKILSKWSQI
ncbi:3-dehydroquinate synthase [Helicobacter sp. 13S00477-4]|uniref:3-dehydroquinate synthase n=1 Tax=Helicobacter sp. 13S00477-4 TaxID=1905759 RepID=UPI000BA5368F|nr:3-dehydroquinate synthase [Helicobacter sp. 13S00477-4]PAF51643.1 3-dehydroquinate synthase [Helicobacter sp. 13S00477-4]